MEDHINLTLKWSRPSALPLVVKGGGSLWTLTQESTFPNEFGGEMQATDKVIQKNQNTEKKNRKSDIQLQNGGKKKNNFYLATKNFRLKMGKLLSRRNFSLKFGS